ncbi:TetR/AcrR family transcriptional regulator [Streptomyces diastaticus]|uniref:TetR/AcrR family transcriptional regulator n=1 Tax=Streptomyces diastaticus TaxID=1956 RepID=UPI0035DDEFEA
MQVTETPGEDRRRRRARRTRAALAAAALDLVLERGLGAVTVEAVAGRADVTRRTFSRHFGGKEDAALDFTRDDGAAINAALRARPACEPPLVAYRRAVRDWLADAHAPGRNQLPRTRSLLALVDDEPTLFAVFERIRADAQEESVRIIAERLGTDPAEDPGPGVVAGAAAGVLTAALRQWWRGGPDTAERLPDLVEQSFDVLLGEVALAAPHAP